ncbi:XdhC family protein [uncultured Erythrobacter sp.]|uniref:XdhC family protein n=1 Tax=uncultured Erythrobacter sp. TaxID=263913 RepID=UPI002609C03A|nr:XdhC family protein [uncultured Erythrobacter sp.]
MRIDPDIGPSIARPVVEQLDQRRAAKIDLPAHEFAKPFSRHYIPPLRIVAFGDGGESRALRRLGSCYGADVSLRDAAASSQQLSAILIDSWTAIVCLAHEHEWERVILLWALETNAFYVGAIGGAKTRAARLALLDELAVPPEALARLRAPVGLFESARHPDALAVSLLAELVERYERLVDEMH